MFLFVDEEVDVLSLGLNVKVTVFESHVQLNRAGKFKTKRSLEY